MQESRAGYRTTEFWLTLVGSALVGVSALADKLPGEWAAVLAIAGVIGYAISRGVAKHGVPAEVDDYPEDDDEPYLIDDEGELEAAELDKP